VSKASRRPTRKETINKVTDIAVESIRDHREHILESEMNDDEIDEYIKKMISQKLVGNTVPKPTKKAIEVKQISASERAKSLLERLKKKQVEVVDDFDDDEDY
jgi:cobalamin biosynthesis protein CobT